MNFDLPTILVILALIAFVLAAISFTWRKTDLIAVGLALWALSQFIGHLSSLNVKSSCRYWRSSPLSVPRSVTATAK